MTNAKQTAGKPTRSVFPAAAFGGCLAAILMAATAGAWQEKPGRTILKGDAAPATSFAFSPDGRRVAAASGNQVRVWNAEMGNEVFHVEGRGASSAMFSADGKRLAVTWGRGAPAVYNAENGEQLLTIDVREPQVEGYPFPPRTVAVALSPDGRRLATVGAVAKVGGPHGYPGGGVKVWDLETKTLVREYRRPVKPGSRYDSGLSTVPRAVAFSPGGKLLAVGTAGAGGELPEPGLVYLWETDSGKLLHTLHGKTAVRPGDNHCAITCLSFSADGKQLAWADSEGVVRIAVLPAGTVRFKLQGHKGWVRAVAFSPRGDRLATGGDDGAVNVWDAATGKRIKTLEGGKLPIRAVAFSADGKSIEAAGGTTSRFAPGIPGLIDQDAPRPRAAAGAGEVLHWNITPVP